MTFVLSCTAFAALRWRLRRAAAQRCLMLHLLDSAVTIAVLAKKRSSSHVLHRVVRRYAALELAASVHMVFGFVRSDHNPADAPSRRFSPARAPPTSWRAP